LDHDRFARVQNELRSLTHNLKSNYEENLASIILRAIQRHFGKYVNSKMKTRLPVDTLIMVKLSQTKIKLILSINILQAFSPRKI